ncbi:MAG: hypothetical protein N2C14_11935, partial [Planctomycetales bacterium]
MITSVGWIRSRLAFARSRPAEVPAIRPESFDFGPCNQVRSARLFEVADERGRARITEKNRNDAETADLLEVVGP